MPVRIYDISKKLGLENKEVLTKAKALGIAAKVASSSLDKITAESLEQQLIQDHPTLAAPPAASIPAPAHVHEPIMLVTAPPPETEADRDREASSATATALLEPDGSSTQSTEESAADGVAETETQAESETAEITEPPLPLGPKVCD